MINLTVYITGAKVKFKLASTQMETCSMSGIDEAKLSPTTKATNG